MTIEEILAGESKNVEFKENLPEKSIKYMPLQMLYQTAVNRQSSRILLYKRLMARLLLW